MAVNRSTEDADERDCWPDVHVEIRCSGGEQSDEKTICCVVPLLMLLAVCPAVAQGGVQSQDAAQPVAASATSEQEKNVQAYIELLREDVRHQKAEIMGVVMRLNADQAAKFWPIYSEYDAELAKLNDQRVANIEDYARSYGQMTDAKADELVQNAFNYRKQRSELLEKYYGRMKASVGSIEAARFVQVESQLLDIIDLQIASNLPIAPSGS